VLKDILEWLKNNVTFLLWIVVLVPGSIYWCRFMGQGDPAKMRLVLALLSCSFAVGAALGFLFTSYGEEQSTIGKVRDWLIGIIAGLGLAQAIEQGGTLKKILQKFQFSQSDNDFALVMGTAIAYAALGFFFMFFQRELILNVALASKRAERGRLDGTGQAGLVVIRTLSVLPASVLAGVDDIDQISKVAPDEATRLRESLYSTEVETFLSQAAAALRDGAGLDWDVIRNVAYIHYYRTYFEPRDKKPAQIQHAMDWLLRALTINPLHADLTMKYADMLISDKEYAEAEAVLQRLSLRADAPFLVKQWLGFVLLFLPQKVNEAIKCSESFHEQFPDDADPLFNAACGYAQLYCKDLQSGKPPDKNSENRKNALSRLREALNLDPSYVDTVASRWTENGEDFACFKSDEDFIKLVEEFKQRAPKPADAGGQPSGGAR